MLLWSVRLVAVHTSDKISQLRGNRENKKKTKIKTKENKLSFSTEIALHSLKPLLLNCPALSIKVLGKLSYRLIEQAAVVWGSQKTEDSNGAVSIEE